MHYTIEQQGEQWVLALNGTAVGAPFDTYDEAVAALAAQLTAANAAAAAESSTGLLPETWTDVGGIAFSEALASGRDFTGVVWSSRDPQTSLLPLMLQTSTDMGHMGAELAGFIEQIDTSSDTPHASGRFYDTPQGVAARDLLLDGRRFGVSVDPSENVTATWECTETDADGWCVDGVTFFTAYEIAGLTMTPFPAFEQAAIVLAGATAAAADEPHTFEPSQDDATICAVCGLPEDDPIHTVPADGASSAEAPADAPATIVVTASALDAPPSSWFTLPEPQLGEPFLGTLGDEFLVDQGDGSVACPLTITDDGQVFGHLARWGQCHVGYPGACVTPPESAAAYAHFHVGEVRTDDGARFAVGNLTVSCEHAPDELDAWAARDHYANSGNGWASVRVSSGELGPWVCGTLRPDVTPEQLSVLRSLTLSGDWRRIGDTLELIGALAVNVPGFPVAREAIVASGISVSSTPMPSAHVVHGEQQSLVAAGLVARCSECQKRLQSGNAPRGMAAQTDDGEIMSMLKIIEARTRHLIPAEAAARLARLRAR